MKANRITTLLFPSVILIVSPVHAQLMTTFDEETLPAGLGIDIPNPGLASILLDTEADELTFETNGNTDLWVDRNNAPLAWAANPSVALGGKWYVETEVRYNGVVDGSQRVAGIAFYADTDGVGGSSGGMDFSYGLNDWDNRGIEVQGLGGSNAGDSGTRFINWGSGVIGQAQLRVEVEELGAEDRYVFFYRVLETDPWIELASLLSGQDNSRAALFFKNGGGTAPTDRSVSFTFFNVAPLIAEPETPLEISEITYNQATDQISITWPSAPGSSYALKFSTDMTDWSSEVDNDITATGETVTYEFANPLPANPAGKLFFRVEGN